MKDIIKELNQNIDVFKKEAILEARKNKKEVSDIFIKNLENFANNMDSYQEDGAPFSVFYSVYLLAEFQDKRLFPILIRIYNNEEVDPYDLFGELFDALTRIVGSVFNNDYESINSIIENSKINKYVRYDFLKCYSYFYQHNMITLKELEDYLRHLIKKYDYQDDFIYTAILDVILNNHIFSLLDEVKKMYQEDVIERDYFGSYDSALDKLFTYGKEEKYDIIKDAIKEMSWWACFDNEDDEDENHEDLIEEAFDDMIEECTQSILKPKKVGRNDPCPCGSGKKYKNCCLDKDKSSLPYQEYINAVYDKYPKRKTNENQLDLYDFYKEEYIEIDKLLYKAMKAKKIPFFIERDRNKEDIIDSEYYHQAFEKIKELLKKEPYKTLDDYDKTVSIHFTLFDFLCCYYDLLCKLLHGGINNSKYLPRLEDLTRFFYENFEHDNHLEKVHIDQVHSLYYFNNKLSEGIEYFKEQLKNYEDDMKYAVYIALFDLIFAKDDDSSRADELIEQEPDEELKERLEDLKNHFLYY